MDVEPFTFINKKIFMVLINNTYCGNFILIVFTSRTYLKQTRNGLDGSRNMFCVLLPPLYTPFHYLNGIHRPHSRLLKFHTLSLSVVPSLTLTFTHSISLNLISFVGKLHPGH